MSVLAGDWLYMQAFQMALTERNFRVLDLLIELTQNMVEGELLQLTRIGRMDLTEQEAHRAFHTKNSMPVFGMRTVGRSSRATRRLRLKIARRIWPLRRACIPACG